MVVKEDNRSGLTWYRVSYILDILFKFIGLSLNDGKTCCKATKTARNESMLFMKKIFLGRKIDFLVNSFSLDLINFPEWQKSGVSISLCEQQQVKNCQTNCAILRELIKLPIKGEQKGQVTILGMDWIDPFEYLFAVKQIDDTHVCFHLENLLLPLLLTSRIF